MSPDDFRQILFGYQRPTREMIVAPGDSGCEPITKISGIPWWPADVPRPTCNHGHPMSFMAQFLLSDVPLLESYEDSLASFHYCQQCAYEGNMPIGWNPKLGKTPGYDVSVFDRISEKQPDLLGTIAEVVIDPQSITFRDSMDAPGYEDIMYLFDLHSIPEDYPQGTDDFDENIYPGIIHIAKRKIGGWPTWVQHPGLPGIQDQERLHFIAQLDWMLCDRATWGSGGYAYLFIIASGAKALRGELVLQTT